jgi:hypothetical protein
MNGDLIYSLLNTVNTTTYIIVVLETYYDQVWSISGKQNDKRYILLRWLY